MTVTDDATDQRRLTRPVNRVALAMLGAAAVAMVVALWLGKGAPRRDSTGLVATGLVTGWAQPVFRLVADITTIGCIGALVAALVLLPADGNALRSSGKRAVDHAALLAGIWSLAALAQSVVTGAVILGIRLSDLPNRLGDVVELKDVRVLAISAVWAAFAAAAVSGTDTKLGATTGLGLALGGLVPPLFVGHAWGDEIKIPAVGSRILHVLAAAVWIGGLVAVARYGRKVPRDELPGVVSRFSRIALGCAVAVGLSGVLVALLHLHGRDGTIGTAFSALFNRAYGGVVLAKLAGFFLVVAAGYYHRRRTIRELASGEAGPFYRLVAVELTIMFATIGLAVALSRTP